MYLQDSDATITDPPFVPVRKLSDLGLKLDTLLVPNSSILFPDCAGAQTLSAPIRKPSEKHSSSAVLQCLRDAHRAHKGKVCL